VGKRSTLAQLCVCSFLTPLFAGFGADPPSAKLQRLTAFVIGAFVAVQLYFSFIPLLPRVPAAIFEAARIVLLVGAAAGLFLAPFLMFRGRGEVDFRAWVWFAASLLSAALCGWTLLLMTFPWVGG